MNKPKKRLLPEAFHPGEYIREEAEERGWSLNELAHKLKCSLTLLHGVVCKKQPVSPKMAVALGDVFGTSAQIWLNLQATYEFSRLEKRRRENEKTKEA